MCQSTCIIHNFVAFEHAYLYIFILLLPFDVFPKNLL